jgi:HK97 family phage portal protein
MSVARALLGRPRARRDQFYREGIIPDATSWYGGGRGITQDEAVRIAAIQSCISLLDDTISTLPIGAFVRAGEARLPVPDPDWMRQPIPTDPSVTIVDHLGQLIWSQALDGNSFTLAIPDVFDPAELQVVNPTRVFLRTRGVYELSMDGGGREVVGPDQMIHIARGRRAGALRGMSPVEEAGATFAMKKAAERFSERVFNQGVFLSGQMLLPGPAATEVIDQLKAEIAEQYGGAANAGKPGIFANGAKWDVPQLNLADMQLVELHKWAKLEAAGLWRIPPYLIGVTDPGAMSHGSVDAQGIDFEKYTIRGYVVRIERAYDRLLSGTETFVRLNTSGLQRGDFKTRTEGYGNLVDHKIMRPAEVRALEDLPPDPEFPGYLETPNNNFAGQAPETRSTSQAMRTALLTPLRGGR